MFNQEGTGNHPQEAEVEPKPEPKAEPNIDALSGAQEPKPFEKFGIINAQQSCAFLK